MANELMNTCSACSGFIPQKSDACPQCDAPNTHDDREAGNSVTLTNAPIYGAPPQVESTPADGEADDRETAFLKKILSYFRGM